MNESKVLIVILNFNRAGDTLECISSLEKIIYTNYKILLIDNASTDNSFRIFEERLPYIPKYRTSENLGYTGGVNYGLKKAIEFDPSYILLLNNDTIVEPDFLTQMIVEMEEKKEVAASCGLILAEHDRETIWYAGGKLIYWRALAVHLLKGKKKNELKKITSIQVNFITGCMILLRTDLLNDIGLEDERYFMYLDDIEFSSRIIKKGYKLLFIPRAIIYHKVLNEKISLLSRYYSVRNRFLLLKSLNKGLLKVISYTYFVIILMAKLIYWKIFNTNYYNAARAGVIDYFNRNFNKGRGSEFLINY